MMGLEVQTTEMAGSVKKRSMKGNRLKVIQPQQENRPSEGELRDGFIRV